MGRLGSVPLGFEIFETRVVGLKRSAVRVSWLSSPGLMLSRWTLTSAAGAVAKMNVKITAKIAGIGRFASMALWLRSGTDWVYRDRLRRAFVVAGGCPENRKFLKFFAAWT